MDVIKLEGVEKIYRTKEIETVALENSEPSRWRRGICKRYGSVGMWQVHAAQSDRTS